REVRRPLDVVDTNVVTNLEAEAVHLESPVGVLIDIPAGLVGPLVCTAPVPVTAPVLIGVFFELRYPADLRLREEKLQVRESVKGAILDELDHLGSVGDRLGE